MISLFIKPASFIFIGPLTGNVLQMTIKDGL